MTRCPLARTSRHGRCRAPGPDGNPCGHGTAARSVICRCCLIRLGQPEVDRIGLARSMASHEAFAAMEAEALAKLAELGAPATRAKRGFGRRW